MFKRTANTIGFVFFLGLAGVSLIGPTMLDTVVNSVIAVAVALLVVLLTNAGVYHHES